MRARSRLSSSRRSDPSRVRSWVFEARKIWLATLAECGAVIVETSGIGRRRIAVGHSLIERAMDDGDGLARTSVGAQHSFAAQGKLAHLPAGAP